MNGQLLGRFLKARPRVAFGAYLPSELPMRDFFQRRYPDIQGEYMGQLGRQAISGITPNLKFLDFLKDYDWRQKYYGYSPQQRGMYPSRLAPPARFLNF